MRGIGTIRRGVFFRPKNDLSAVAQARAPYMLSFFLKHVRNYFVIFSKWCCKRVRKSEKMDKKNVQKRDSTKHFWEKTRGLYNKWAEGLKEGAPSIFGLHWTLKHTMQKEKFKMACRSHFTSAESQWRRQRRQRGQVRAQTWRQREGCARPQEESSWRRGRASS